MHIACTRGLVLGNSEFPVRCTDLWLRSGHLDLPCAFVFHTRCVDSVVRNGVHIQLWSMTDIAHTYAINYNTRTRAHTRVRPVSHTGTGNDMRSDIGSLYSRSSSGSRPSSHAHDEEGEAPMVDQMILGAYNQNLHPSHHQIYITPSDISHHHAYTPPHTLHHTYLRLLQQATRE